MLNKTGNGDSAFSSDDETVARHLADQAAVALRRATLLDSERIKEKLEADLQIARRIQQSSLPSGVPEIDGFSIAASTRPAEATGGDSFDLISIRDMRETGAPLPPAGGLPSGDALMMFMGDATGHGIGPALSVTQATSMLRMACRLSASLEVVVRLMNRQLFDDLPLGRFITGFFGVLDPATKALSYISAGQAPLVLLRESSPAAPDILASTTMPLGIDPDLEITTPPPIALEVGDLFAVLSDGYYEALDDNNRMFGVDRVIEVISGSRTAPVENIVAALDAAVDAHAGGTSRDDDQTALLIRRDR